MWRSRLPAAACVVVLSPAIWAGPAAAADPGSAPVVTWAASADRVGDAVPDQSYRLVVHTSAGGRGLRIRLSNVFGEQPVVFGRAYAGVRQAGAAVVPGSNRALSFGGSGSVTVQPGVVVYSDPLSGTVAPQSDLVVSVYVKSAGGTATGHGMAMQTSYVAAGDHVAEDAATAFTRQIGSWFYLDALVVDARGTGAVAVLGDSITDGWQSTGDRNNRWPDYLARRLASEPGSNLRGVANEGISGNKVLVDGAGQSALRRLDRDVLTQPGLRTVILLEGVNDIKGASGATADDMIAGYRQIIARAHLAGKCVVGATILPFQGWYEWTEAAEAVRQEINSFIRTSGEFDATVDFDTELRSPYDHTRLFPPFDGGDHLHPDDKGMQAMADSVDLASLRC
jgi:lysophospholipase L1-like esterase